jgi:hypothetical protein
MSKLLYTTEGNIALEESEKALLEAVEAAYSFTDILSLREDVWEVVKFEHNNCWNHRLNLAWEKKLMDCISLAPTSCS